MEEKEVTFNIVSGIKNTNGMQNIGITSDIDDCLDYITREERICLIIELITQCMKSLSDDVFGDSGVIDCKENLVEQDVYDETVADLLDNLIYATVNTIHSFKNVKLGKKPRKIDYSLALYEFDCFIKGMQMNKVIDTMHSYDVTAIDPIQSATEFFTDTVWCLLETKVNKDEIRKLVDGSLLNIRQMCMDMINDYRG